MNTVVESELEATKEWLIGLKPLLRGYSVDTITNMSSGNAWIEHLCNGDIINIRYRVDDPDTIQFQKCSEGFPVGSDTFVIPVNAQHPGTALLLIDFMCDPKNAARNVNWNGYPMPNRGQDQTFADLARIEQGLAVSSRTAEAETRIMTAATTVVPAAATAPRQRVAYPPPPPPPVYYDVDEPPPSSCMTRGSP